jgi:flagellar motor switch/type III secretory pathway protein FliN
MPLDAARVRPFPWNSLEALTRAEVTAWNDLRRWAATHARLDEFALALESLLGVHCAIVPRGIHLGNLRDVAGTGFGVLLHRAHSDDPLDSVLLNVEPALAGHVVARATKRPIQGLIAQVPVSASIAGAFAAVLATALRRVHTDSFLRPASVGPSADLVSRMAIPEAESVVARLTIILGDDAFDARIATTRSALAKTRSSPWSREYLARLGPVPLSVPIVACCDLCPVNQLADMRRGDALVWTAWPLQRKRDRWVGGPVWLAPPAAQVGLRARFDDEGILVLGTELDPLDDLDSPMSAEELDAVVTTVGDALVSVRVELANAVMPAREWAALGPGAIVMLGQRVGEAVLIRVGGVPVARGDLIDVDGEVGVRIVARLSDLDRP